MPNSNFDLKYRPAKFSDVVGNVGVVKLLLTRSSSGTLAGRSMMFGGPKGCGKTSLARIVARAIACTNLSSGEPCGTCEGCISVQHGSSSSYDEYDAATQGTVDKIRELVDDLEYGTLDGKPRVVILDEAQRLTKGSQDALLRSMEDRRIIVILCTTEPHSIKTAIRSRVEEYPVQPPPMEGLMTLLESVCVKEGVSYDRDSLEAVVRACGQCPRTCLTSLETLALLGGVRTATVSELFRHDSFKQVVQVLENLDKDLLTTFNLVDDLLLREGPTWTRDTLVSAIMDSIRVHLGCRTTFPVSTSLFPIRGMGWSQLAASLAALYFPSSADVISCLVSSRPSSQWVPTGPSERAAPTPTDRKSVV